ncbi:unnamed protein product [Linum tenue]|uniref:Uncharacterized protein n=1 Tax=Linum tenue TaxID=586396 RepID=A0AAV0JJ99_9ROSI|nr:unnamed protein product [Linum tenue]
MRGRGFSIPTNFVGNHAPKSSSAFFTPFSTSSGGGRGAVVVGSSLPANSHSPTRHATQKRRRSLSRHLGGLGHGRGKPLASGPVFPEFSSFISSLKQTAVAPGSGSIGRGSGMGVAAEGPRLEKHAPGAPGRGSVPPAK